MDNVVVVINDDEQALLNVPAGSAALLIFLRERLSPAEMKRLSGIVAPRLALGGAGIVATSIEEALERL